MYLQWSQHFGIWEHIWEKFHSGCIFVHMLFRLHNLCKIRFRLHILQMFFLLHICENLNVHISFAIFHLHCHFSQMNKIWKYKAKLLWECVVFLHRHKNWLIKWPSHRLRLTRVICLSLDFDCLVFSNNLIL